MEDKGQGVHQKKKKKERRGEGEKHESKHIQLNAMRDQMYRQSY